MSIPLFLPHAAELFPERSKPWLILGKGPSLSRFTPELAAGSYVLGLNHVSKDFNVDIAHAIDVDVIQHCGDALLERARYVVMPWIPHMKHRPDLLTPKAMLDASGITLEEWVHMTPVLAELARRGRLFCYNLSTAPPYLRRADDPHVIDASYFSAEAVVNLLALAGRRVIRTLGIDGGTTYDKRFHALSAQTLLANGQANFDLQFRGITRSILKHDLDFSSADVETPIRVFVGAEDGQALAVKVLEYSIRKHATMSVKVESLHEALAARNMHVPTPASPELAPRTPFSYQRFAIPALKDHRGRAIYLDSDMQVFDDIRKLWTMPFDGAPMLAVEGRPESGRRPQFSVALLDCEALDWDVGKLIAALDSGRWTYHQFMYEMAAAPGARASIPSRWNDLERYVPGETALTHYTDMNTQPWLETINPIGRVWCQSLFEALASGFVSRDLVVEEIARQHVRPSLLAQIDLQIEDPLLLPRSARALDRNFLPPHVAAGYGVKAGSSGASIRRVKLARKVKHTLLNIANSLGFSGSMRALKSRVKQVRQNRRIANARRDHGMG